MEKKFSHFVIDFTKKKNFIETFKNIHKDEDIYVIASGKSLDFINISFFQDKISIAVNQVYKKIDSPYIVRKEHQHLPDTLIHMKKDQILFLPIGSTGDKNKINKIYIEENHAEDNRIVLFQHDKNNLLLKELPNDDKIVVSWSTITSAIHLAAYMGAKNIVLVGHDCGTLDNEKNYKGYHTKTTMG